jgi:2-methylcitrate dehydratase PrpD
VNAYEASLLDWMACAYAGRRQRAAQAAQAVDVITWLGTAGHVLDFDDTYLPGIAHLSAPTAPAAIVMAARFQATIGEALEAYAAGFEAMGALSRSHRLYDGGWHPTAVCGATGAAVVTARILGGDEATAVRLALLQAGGLRAAFGSDGKSLQVGMAAAAGVQAGMLAVSGAVISPDVMDAPDGFAAAFGARVEDDGRAAIDENWIKPWPCCLMSHSAVEAATIADLAGARAIEVRVHPVARRAAAYDEVADGLQAKFSIPYLTAYTLLHGPPTVASFTNVDGDARRLAERVRVRTDAALLESEAVLEAGGARVGHVHAARGSPARPMDPTLLRGKLHALAGDRLDGLLDDLAAPVAQVVDAASLH